MRAAFVTANRRLDLTPNQGLSWPVRLRSSPHNDIGFVGKDLALLLPRRREAIGQTTEIVVIASVGLMMFGPARIPEFAKQCGKAVSLFKNGMREALDEELAEPVKATKRRAKAR